MTDGQKKLIKNWMKVLSAASCKVKEGSEKYVLYTGMAMTLGAVLYAIDESGPDGHDVGPYMTGFDAIVRDITGFGVRIQHDPNTN